MDDLVTIDYPHEADLALKLGYTLYCDNVEPVVKIRHVGHGFEVLTQRGWKMPTKCWGVLQAKRVEVEQGELFK